MGFYTSFRPAAGGVLVDVAANAPARAEAGLVVDAGIGAGRPAAPADPARLVDLVSSQAGIAPRDAATRVDRTQFEIEVKAERAANYAREADS